MRHGEEVEMSDMALIGSATGPKSTKREQAAAPGSQPALLVERSVSPQFRYSLYGTRILQVEKCASRDVRGQKQVTAPSLGQHLKE